MKKSLSRSKITATVTIATALAPTATTTVVISPSSAADIIETKIQNATEGLSSEYFNYLHNKVLPTSSENALTICDYMSSLKSEINPSDNYRKNNIILLCTFSMFFKSNTNTNTKLFKDITRDDILSFLDSYRKIESVDPLHKWVGTYNLFRVELMRFFKWLYYPDIEYNRRPKPSVIENIPQLKRKEKSIYKPTDLWTPEDDSLFLKYCPNVRDRCYHAMSRDSAARPHELLKLKIKDVVFKLTPDKKQYAEVLLNGKTGTRSIPLINSIPHLKDWISQHPQGGNPNSILLCGFGKSLNKMINIRSLNKIYENYKVRFFPRLLDSPNVPPEDKQKIKELLRKPFCPYIRRHSALTGLSTILKEHTLRQFAGWSPGSNMHLKYLHYFGGEASESILEAYGMVTKDKNQISVLRPKSCPNCDEPNKPDSRFCGKCKMVLTYDAYNETIEEKHTTDKELQSVKERMSDIENILLAIQPLLQQVKPEMLSKLQILDRKDS